MIAFFAWLQGMVTGIAQILGIVSKYAPPVTPEQKTEDSDKKISDQLQKEQDGARPTWGG